MELPFPWEETPCTPTGAWSSPELQPTSLSFPKSRLVGYSWVPVGYHHTYPSSFLYFPPQIIFLNCWIKLYPESHYYTYKWWPKVRLRWTCPSPLPIARTCVSPSRSVLVSTVVREPGSTGHLSPKEAFRKATELTHCSHMLPPQPTKWATPHPHGSEPPSDPS